MPKRTDIKSILIIGAGPIIIGQACEFDYSGTQACKALREEGYRVILINSNPATIMTDPGLADATYIEPITPEIVAKVIEKERPDALLPTMGGQTALNTAMKLAETGVLASMATGSRGGHEQIAEFRNLLTMLQSVGKRAQRQCLDSGPRLLSCASVCNDALKRRNIGDPSAIVLPLEFDPKHARDPPAPSRPSGA